MEVNKFEKGLNLDNADKKILYYLSHDFRFSRKKLSGILKISPENLNYKINRLKRYVIEPAVVLNFIKLGLKNYIILIENLDKSEYEDLSKNDSIFILAELMGEKRYIAYVICEDLNEFLIKNLSDKNVNIMEVHEYHVDYFNPFHLRPRVTPHKKNAQKLNLDKYDYKILRGVTDNPESSILDLSHKLKIDRITLKKHLKKLEDYDYIRIYRYALNSSTLGVQLYLMNIQCMPSQKKKVMDLTKTDDYAGTNYETHNGILLWYLCPNQKDIFTFYEKIKEISQDIKITINNTGSYVLTAVPKVVKDFLSERAG